MNVLRRAFLAAFYHFGGVALCRWMFRHECVVLMYHGVVAARPDAADDRDGLFALEPDFVRQLDYLRKHYNPVTPEQFEASLHGGPALPPRAVLITVDDGYENNARVMAPRLAEKKMSAIVFLTTGLIGTARTLWPFRLALQWQDRPGTAPRPESPRQASRTLKTLTRAARDSSMDEWVGADQAPVAEGHPVRMMSWDDVREMRAMGFAFGSHTVGHAILAREDEAETCREIEESKAVMERELRTEITAFAYPNGQSGDYSTRDVELLRQYGFRVAYTAIRGRHRTGDEPLEIFRVAVSREEGWMPLFASRLAFPYGLKGRLAAAASPGKSAPPVPLESPAGGLQVGTEVVTEPVFLSASRIRSVISSTQRIPPGGGSSKAAPRKSA